MDQFNAMSAFVRVVDAGSFTKAAQTLGLPKPSVTRLIQQLEAQLEVRLLHRTTRALTLTSEGVTYYERVVRLLAELEDIVSSTRSSSAAPTGRINVAVSVSLGDKFLVPALVHFNDRYPGIEVAMNATNRDMDLVGENLDCAIRAGAIMDESLVARRIGGFRFTTCASPEYLLKRGRPMTPDELQGKHSTIGFISSRSGSALPFTFARDGERVSFHPQHIFSVNDTKAQLAAGTSGLGVFQAPSFTVRSAIAAGQLVSVLDDWSTDVMPTSIVYPPNRYMSAKVRVFLDWAVELFGNDPDLNLR
jgi:LysR family transcriptional regulator for bpeEF and oprC